MSAKELSVHCSQKIREFEKVKEARNADAIKIVDQYKAINTEMLADGTWLDFPSLTLEKEQVEGMIAKSQSMIDSFFEKINRSIGQQINSSLEVIGGQISNALEKLFGQSKELDEKISKFELLSEHIKAFKPYLTSLSLRESLADVARSLTQRELVDKTLLAERDLVLANLKDRIDSFFFTDLINSIYKKIDPHPTFKEVEFRPDFDLPDRPGLNVILKNGTGDFISPILYFSAAQMNILSLSIFLANALHATNDEGTPLDVILIDDPIQSMDAINVLSTIDLLRSISVRFDKQIIISTHDENFFELLQRKIPAKALGSKFLKLEKFAVVVPVEPLLDAQG